MRFFQVVKVDPETGELPEPEVSIVNPDDLPQVEQEPPEKEQFEGDFNPKLHLEMDLTKKSADRNEDLVSYALIV